MLTQFRWQIFVGDSVPSLMFFYFRVFRVSTGSDTSTESTPYILSKQSVLYTGEIVTVVVIMDVIQGSLWSCLSQINEENIM